MSRVCAICGKKSHKVIRYKKSRSKINPTTTARQKPNLQPFKFADGTKVRACTKCIKTLTKKGITS